MKYDFDTPVERRGTDSYKWDSEPYSDLLPLWVADMDFRVCPAITDALRRVTDRGVFGYVRVPDSYYEAIVRWFRDRHGWNVDPARVIYTSGVVPAVSAIIKALARPGQKVLVQTPVYNCFFSSVRNNGCIVEESPLVDGPQGWRMDFDDLERRAADPDVTLMLLCNPHNPVGRVWTREELQRLAEICARHGVRVVSDEIHCELTMPGYVYTPFATVHPDSTVCISPSKAFNTAGLQIANIVCGDADSRRAIDRAINDNEVCDVNPFGVAALQAAYNDGVGWLDALREYIHGNYLFMRGYCTEHLPQFPLSDLQATYLVWMDVRSAGIPSEELEERLLREKHLWLNAGTMYGAAGEGYLRWNIAAPRSRLREALDRFTAAMKDRD